ncbi:hypothetical protein CRP01_33005 [Flavilitoribacter nigricans DSM 23189 = NBRC 102662]|uniref:Uncharacterized protein n=1 Tax=Flavilitoribacter nigricans (strain ATCC 23147 / DSM 23189 / NBRC 102662 / NCIMB 1420 / SS-2) TaxID=1122177 RepID=A0A2D0N1I2_FLAN2|nr:hypothetical protein CRP01_33005 [Flavilitoribacter nigricans DSM 23189 = NBRC 102662]
MKIKEFRKRINLKWLGWIAIIAVYTSVSFSIETGLYWTTIFALGSIYSFYIYKFSEEFIFSKLDKSEFKFSAYDTSFLVMSAGLLLIIVPDYVLVLCGLLAIFILVIILNLMGYFLV